MFDFLRSASTPPTDLLGIIRYVRARWRARLAVKGAVRALVVNVAVFFALAYLMEWSRFTPASILFARLVLAASVIGSMYFLLIKPLRRRVTDDQVALYLEEKEPSLQTMLISAVESSREGRHWESSALVEKLVAQAIEKCCEADAPRRAEHGPLRVNGAVFAGVVSAAILAVLLGPAFFRHALSAVLILSQSIEAAAPYKIMVTPGNVSVPKGADQTITARLDGFNAQEAALMVKRPASSTYEKLPLVRNDKGDFEGILFGVKGTTEYFVEAEGVGSTHYTLKVVDVPYVDKLGLEYKFPAYTGLEPEKIEDGGDIAVLRGTEVKVIITPTMKTNGGRIALDKEAVPLKVEADGTLTASFKADKDGSYHVELDAPNGERVAASPQYTIDVLTDRQPTVTFARPGRDTSASSIEEVYVEAAADDDYGVKDLELVYSVNGGPEKTVPLFNGSKRLPSVTAGHTFYLEELGVKSGDSVSYYARATDNDAVDGGQKASSDLYFVRVRPFDQKFRQAQSMGGGGGGGGGGQNQVDALSEQQRQIISATFNVQRDKRTAGADKFRQNSTVVGLSQQKLREQVEGLLTRMNSEFIQQDPKFKQIADLLPQAVTAMKEAEGKLSATAPDQALGPENKALTLLQKAEEEYETQVSVQQGGGGGGGGQSSQQRELADIFEQELDKMASRYETADRAMQANGDRQVDELLEKLKELARRQEQEAERERRLQQGSASSTPSGSAQQRALADQAEEAARRLERLAREENRPELLDSARQMREAADAMRRAAAGGNTSAASQAQQALDRLKETQRKLERSLSDRADRDIKDAQQRAEELAREQQEIANGVNGLAANGQQRREQAQRINEKKDDLEQKLGQLEGDLDAAARDAAQQERNASRKLSEAAGAIRDNRLRDKIRYSEALVNRGYGQETLRATENDIAGGIDQLKKRLDEAAAALGQGQQQNAGSKAEQALDRTQRLARGLESLQERTRERAQQNARNQQGRDQQGQQGQQGQRGQQGQEGQQGQQGQQGQGQQGQEGQQGQGGQQGQSGQQGGQQAGGQQGGQQAGGANGGFGPQNGYNGGYDRGGYGYGYGNLPWNGSYYNGTDFGRLSDEDIRQLRSEARQWANEAQDLRGMLRGFNVDPKELEQILAALRRLEDERIYKDAKELQSLQTFATEGLKRLEFGLRRQVESGDEAVVLTGSDEVPDQFKKMVAEYYRSLGKTPR